MGTPASLLTETSEFDEARSAAFILTSAAELKRRKVEDKLAYYAPYPKQLEFHAAGATARERLLMAGNQTGKTFCGAMEAAMHLTGEYSSDWQGRRFDKPVNGWACGETNEQVRDVVQRLLLGRPGQLGTGSIPKHLIVETVSGRGIADLFDGVRVRHVSGGVSTLGFKSYQRGRESFAGETLHFCWLDEEPPADIYFETLARISTTDGCVWITFTPLLGMSEVVRRFLLEKGPGRSVVQMTIDDARHFSPEQRAQIIAQYPSHEREARLRGIPVLGSGRIFPVSEESITCDQREFPRYWPRLGCMDFGWEHPFAAVELVWDRDADVVYVARAHRLREATPVLHAAAIRAWGKDLPWAWPRDGRRETLEGAGIALAKQYEAQGLNMLSVHAQFDDKSVSVEAGLMDMLDRMQTGRFKVFRHLNDWFEEFRLYHRKDGRVVKEGDDLLAATRYGVMMLRYAECINQPKRQPERRRYAPGAWMAG